MDVPIPAIREYTLGTNNLTIMDAGIPYIIMVRCIPDPEDYPDGTKTFGINFAFLEIFQFTL